MKHIANDYNSIPMKTYNPWPNGLVPKHLQRPEIQILKELGYVFDDARELNAMFESRIANFAGSEYCILTDCCTHALELCLRYQLQFGHLKTYDRITIPENTYVSVYHMLKQIGMININVEPIEWSGVYHIKGTNVIDGAVRWERNMYIADAFQCVSFQIKKMIPIGRGGCILTNSKEAADWLRLATYDGRDLTLPYDHPDHVKMSGYHYYMTPEDAARGLMLMDMVEGRGDTGNHESYPNIKKMLKL